MQRNNELLKAKHIKYMVYELKRYLRCENTLNKMQLPNKPRTTAIAVKTKLNILVASSKFSDFVFIFDCDADFK
jgi:hypothetical protein